ncbi:hypothetical protein IWQ60_010827 [Tieghemiomyces parasiticus]|uniref:DUF3835 domain-containing protein n=1 Tax=Tieghemiomyces parasiticus TaxID=78921 RepID=A0A9W7ZTG7_9FUNG|nr:hypothetical protein IWQ60_010827 [Tieghemiomyces parasiticus]
MDTPQPVHLDRFASAIQERIAAQRGNIRQYEQFLEDYEALSQELKDLPQRRSYDVQVPLGPLAFMPGQIVHTNEVTVLLGDNWFVEQSALDARGIAQRRIEYIAKKLSDLRAELELMTGRLGVASALDVLKTDRVNEDGEPIVDIVEHVAEGDVDPVTGAPVGVAAASNIGSAANRTTTTSELVVPVPVRDRVQERSFERREAEERDLLERLRILEAEEAAEAEAADSQSDADHSAMAPLQTPTPPEYLDGAGSELQSLDQAIAELNLTEKLIAPTVLTHTQDPSPSNSPGPSPNQLRPLRSSLKSPMTPPPLTKKNVSFDVSRNQIIVDDRQPSPPPELTFRHRPNARIVMLPPGGRDGAGSSETSSTVGSPSSSSRTVVANGVNQSDPAPPEHRGGGASSPAPTTSPKVIETTADLLERIRSGRGIISAPLKQLVPATTDDTPTSASPAATPKPASAKSRARTVGGVREKVVEKQPISMSDPETGADGSEDEELEQEFLMREVSHMYNQRRQAIAAQRGHFVTDKSKQAATAAADASPANQDPEEKPKRVSRFKAARMAGGT